MKTHYVRQLKNWGNYPAMPAEIATPDNVQEAAAYVQGQSRLIARGMGRCYGDAALCENVLSTLNLNKIRHFDAENGVIDCESGVLLSDILSSVFSQGWFFHVTPGTTQITVGGAIASDVHGKNHPGKGCFSNWLESFELLTGDGDVVFCSKTQNPDLFWQTCGGMGWTGVILSARFQLMRVSSTKMRQNAIRAGGLEALFQAFETNTGWPYAAGWLDCLACGAHFGRGVVYLAEHSEMQEQNHLEYPLAKARNVPFYAPSWMLNPLSIRAHNALLFSGAKTEIAEVDLDRYFYPLDRVLNWNRLYGRRGFIQYQFCLPREKAFDGLTSVLETVKKSADIPFLSVLKRHGDRLPEAINTFPIAGYSLALDFPLSGTIFRLVEQLDETVWRYDGKIYLTKDACSASRMSRIIPQTFGAEKFSSALRERISTSQTL